jgi:hypothetical protein
LHPVPGAEIEVTTGYGSMYGIIYDGTPVSLMGLYLGPSADHITENFTTNNEGRYQVRLAKSVTGSGLFKTYCYYIHRYYFKCNNRGCFELDVEDVKDAKNGIVLLDTIKLPIK